MKPESAREAALAALREGLSPEVAAERSGASATTIRGWIRKGRRDPEGEFAAFVIEKPAEDHEPMTPAELERHIATAIRKGRVSAMALWQKMHGQEFAPVEGDPFSEFDPR